jgi:hypothetical protein
MCYINTLQQHAGIHLVVEIVEVVWCKLCAPKKRKFETDNSLINYIHFVHEATI